MSSRRPGRIALLLLAGVAAAAAGAATPAVARPATPEVVSIETTPIRDFDVNRRGVTRFGSLEFLGGLVLSAASRQFGGFSGILDLGGGELLLVSDDCYWMSGRLVSDASGAPVDFATGRIEPLIAPEGGPIKHKQMCDPEAATIDTSRGVPRYLVSLEHGGMILDYPAPPFGNMPSKIAQPPGFATAPENGRGEAIAVVPAGRPYAGSIVTFVESPGDDGRVEGGIRVDGRWRPLSITAPGGYSITDAAFLPGGDLLVLERRLQLLTGLGMRIRRIPADTIRPDAVLDGEVLLQAGMAFEIDNMEGLAVGVDGAGRTVLTLVSDDNRSSFQRTLLLRFVLAR